MKYSQINEYKYVVLMLLGLFLVECCSGEKESSKSTPQPNSDTSSEFNSDTDLAHDATMWRNWKPWKLWKLGRSMLNKGLTHSEDLESALERRHIRGDRSRVTRRESSLITSRRYSPCDDRAEYETYTAGRPSAVPLMSDSGASLSVRPKGSIQKELITMLFESMLDSIVSSWEVIAPHKPEDSNLTMAFGKSPSELTFATRKKKSGVVSKAPTSQTSKPKRSKLELSDVTQADPIHQTWWSSPDERAIIRFRNGNVYEGSISMKRMQGEGRFQWADGTVYLGQFRDNQMNGKGIIQWKDDTWYEGDFVGNVRHGRGLYVDSRKQRSYAGGWYCGTKNGEGVIYYSKTFKNSYDGEWIRNVRHGFGSREYSPESGYKGEWDKYVREGRGLMIWPNHDFYRGEWKNGVMSGYGIYIWDAYYNNSLSLPSISAYRGQWIKGQRNGYGVLNLGLGLGSYYKGDFKNNKKHGVGKLVTNNGLILHDRNLFIDDNIGPMSSDDQETTSLEYKRMQLEEPYKFDICDSTVGLLYHVQDAINNIDRQTENRANIINDYIETNKAIEADLYIAVRKEDRPDVTSPNTNLKNLIDFEETSLRKSLRCYETDLKNIYYKYSTICNSEKVHFTPVLIRLYLWQFYHDCNIHEKGLTLVDTDKMFHRNPQWLSKSPHSPFEKIYIWQFMHSLISVASRLYAKRELPGPRPDTILASAFRTFMENDVLPNVGHRKGRLVDGYGKFIPLKGLYYLYRSLNEPHTVRDFLCAIRRAPHYMENPQPPLIDASDECLPLGHNVYIFGDEMTFVSDEMLPPECDFESMNDFEDLKLFNFGNLSSKAVIKVFSNIFPQLCDKKKIMNLDIEITFYEFFEGFIACTEESIRIKDEEMRWREKFSDTIMQVATIQGLNSAKSK